MAEFMNFREVKLYKLRRNVGERDWKSLYRFNKGSVDWLANHFLEENLETRGGALSNEQRFRTFLRYIGDPGFQTGVAEDIGIKQSTVSKIISEVAIKILEKRNVWIKFPATNEYMEEANAIWQEKYSFPCAIGALDCTHIPIMKPSVQGDEYINRKGYASINVLATCNSKELFTSVDSSCPGSVHDSRIWRNSNIYNVMKENRTGGILLGDQGFSLAPWLMTPFRNPNTILEHSFNNLHKRERGIIERCFGQVKRRFPILLNKIRLSTEKIPSVIICCFVLLNAAKYLRDEDFEPTGEMFDEIEVIEEGARIPECAQLKRMEIANAIMNLHL